MMISGEHIAVRGPVGVFVQVLDARTGENIALKGKRKNPFSRIWHSVEKSLGDKAGEKRSRRANEGAPSNEAQVLKLVLVLSKAVDGAGEEVLNLFKHDPVIVQSHGGGSLRAAAKFLRKHKPILSISLSTSDLRRISDRLFEVTFPSQLAPGSLALARINLESLCAQRWFFQLVFQHGSQHFRNSEKARADDSEDEQETQRQKQSSRRSTQPHDAFKSNSSKQGNVRRGGPGTIPKSDNCEKPRAAQTQSTSYHEHEPHLMRSHQGLRWKKNASGINQNTRAQWIMACKDHYLLLNVERGCSKIEVRKAYLRLAKEWHPDKSADPMATECFAKIHEGFEVISKKLEAVSRISCEVESKEDTNEERKPKPEQAKRYQRYQYKETKHQHNRKPNQGQQAHWSPNQTRAAPPSAPNVQKKHSSSSPYPNSEQHDPVHFVYAKGATYDPHVDLFGRRSPRKNARCDIDTSIPATEIMGGSKIECFNKRLRHWVPLTVEGVSKFLDKITVSDTQGHKFPLQLGGSVLVRAASTKGPVSLCGISYI